MGKMIHATALVADVPTKTGHIYSKEALSEIAKQLDERYKMPVTLRTPCYDVSQIGEAVAKITKAYVDGEELCVDVEFLDTYRGKLAESASEEVGFSITPVGTGNVDQDGNVSHYNLLGFNIGMMDETIFHSGENAGGEN